MTLKDKVALVAGATRGAGRGTAIALGEEWTSVYCKGRTTRDRPANYRVSAFYDLDKTSVLRRHTSSRRTAAPQSR